jgi:predicted AAA+ superfamily ATPase
MIPRLLQTLIQENLFKGKAIIIIGPRQVGKTTLVKQVESNIQKRTLFLNCDEMDAKDALSNRSLEQLKDLVRGYEIVIIDEAQRVRDIGITLKLIIDQIPDVQLIVTGSSALELSNNINEPLTGRKFEYNLFPVSFTELKNRNGLFEEKKLLYKRLIYGMYPDIINFRGREQEVLKNLVSSYLYKDMFIYQEIRRPELLASLLKALALQVASEVSYNELSQLLHTDPETIIRYTDLLQKAYIIFQLRSFSRNIRNELKRSKKIYFYDNGIRNALTGNYNPVESRTDTGQLWENFLVSERMKHLHYTRIYALTWFWRTTQQQEIDYLEEYGGKLNAYEFRWNPLRRARIPKTFLNNYEVNEVKTITPDNFWEFI